ATIRSERATEIVAGPVVYRLEGLGESRLHRRQQLDVVVSAHSHTLVQLAGERRHHIGRVLALVGTELVHQLVVARHRAARQRTLHLLQFGLEHSLCLHHRLIALLDAHLDALASSLLVVAALGGAVEHGLLHVSQIALVDAVEHLVNCGLDARLSRLHFYLKGV
ncbi:hypothetical protein PFISCL1PPCAC_12520, partial [Pristionchus fissidentatus]